MVWADPAVVPTSGSAGVAWRLSGTSPSAEAAQSIDVAGRIVAPGFVDIHAHSDFTILSDPRGRSAVRQGITTQVNGNCGMSPVPAPAARADEVRLAVNTVDPDPSVKADWSRYQGYAAAIQATRPAINQAPLIGHITLKVAAGGNRPGPATASERAAMVRDARRGVRGRRRRRVDRPDVPAGDLGRSSPSWRRWAGRRPATTGCSRPTCATTTTG